jgi:tetratricopeptide (TPR) repeat protein
MVRRGQAVDAMPVLNWCVEANDRNADLEDLAYALCWRGICVLDLDDPEPAHNDALRGVASARQSRSRLAEYLNLRLLGNALAWLGAGDRAVSASESALTIAADLGSDSYELAALQSLAFTCTLGGQHERAVTLCLRGIELSQGLGDVCTEALLRGSLGDAFHGLGRYEEAVGSLLRALPVFRSHSSRRFHGVCLLKLGYAYQAMGSPEAVGYIEQSLGIFRQLRLLRRVEQAEHALDRCRDNLMS